MSEFNPTKRDLINVDSLILDIKNKKSKLIGRKISLQNSLSQLRDKYKDVARESKDFYRIKNTRENIKTHLSGIELKILECNEELKFKTKLRLEIEHHLKGVPDTAEVAKTVVKLTALKNKYSDFAKDRTRVASLRVMANEFIEEIDKLISDLT